jgi:hypothetical protein
MEVMCMNVFGRIKKMGFHSLILVLLVVISLLSYSFFIDIRNSKDTWTATTKNLSELEFSVIKSTIRDEVYKAQVQTKLVAEIITKDLLTGYDGNLERIKQDFDTLDPTLPLYKILNEDIQNRFINKDTMNNKILITSKTRIMSTSFSYSTVYERGDDIFKFYGKDKENTSLVNILNKKDTYAIINASGNDINDMSELSDIYAQQGISGLKKYYLLVPAYITESGDMLGVSDINPLGEIQINDKLIVIQQISIYDALQAQEMILSSFKQSSDLTKTEYIGKLNIVYLRNYMTLGLMIIVSLVAVGAQRRC